MKLEFAAAISGRIMKLMNVCALSGCLASAGTAYMSNQMMVPSFGIVYLITLPWPASAARSRDCRMSPLQPTAMQSSPFASASM